MSLIRSLKRLAISRPTACSSTASSPLGTSRHFSSSSPSHSAAAAYPYSSTAQVISSISNPQASTLSTSLLRTLNQHLTSQHPLSSSYSSLLSRRSPNRLLPGSVLTVTSYTSLPTPENPSPSTNTFSGVLIAIRRRHAGRDTSIRLRNLVGRTGVEISYKVFSPMVRDIKVVSAAARSGPKVVGKDGVELARKKPALRASKRAKMYFVRDQPGR